MYLSGWFILCLHISGNLVWTYARQMSSKPCCIAHAWSTFCCNFHFWGKKTMCIYDWFLLSQEHVAATCQVVQLAASGNYNDALALCKLLPPEDAALRAAKEDAIHIRFCTLPNSKSCKSFKQGTCCRMINRAWREFLMLGGDLAHILRY